MRLLVTGGYGFIGSAFVRHALDQGDVVYVLDRMTVSASTGSLREYEAHKRFCKFRLDLKELPKLSHVLDIDHIVHFAAETHVDRSIGDWEKEQDRWSQMLDGSFVETNICGLQALLELTRRNLFGCLSVLDLANAKRIPLLHISTDEVYGPTDTPVNEGAPFRPTNPYAASKVGQEGMCMAYHTSFGVPVTVARLCNQFGPFQSSEKLIPLTILRALADAPIPVYGDGLYHRDWLFVEDTARLLRQLALVSPAGEAFNLVGTGLKANLDVVKQIISILDSKSSIEFVKDRPGHDRQYQMDGSKLERLLTADRTPFEDALKKTCEFYLQNREFYKNQLQRNGALARAERLVETARRI